MNNTFATHSLSVDVSVEIGIVIPKRRYISAHHHRIRKQRFHSVYSGVLCILIVIFVHKQKGKFSRVMSNTN